MIPHAAFAIILDRRTIYQLKIARFIFVPSLIKHVIFRNFISQVSFRHILTVLQWRATKSSSACQCCTVTRKMSKRLRGTLIARYDFVVVYDKNLFDTCQTGARIVQLRWHDQSVARWRRWLVLLRNTQRSHEHYLGHGFQRVRHALGFVQWRPLVDYLEVHATATRQARRHWRYEPLCDTLTRVIDAFALGTSCWKLQQKIDEAHGRTMYSVAWSKSNYLATSGADDSIKIYQQVRLGYHNMASD